MSTNNEPRAVGFESFKRSNPNVKKLASAWRGTPEYESWMNIHLDDDSKVEYLEEDNHQIGTFYRILSPEEIGRAAAVIETVPAEENGDYEVLDVVHEHSDEEETHVITYVRLGKPRYGRVGGRFAYCEFVFVDQWRKQYNGEDAQFTYMETTVSITDSEQNTFEDSILYRAQGYMDVWETMFAIGEIATVTNTDVTVKNDDKDVK